MKANTVRGHQIESCAQVGQGNAPIYPGNYPADIEQFSCGAKQRIVLDIGPEGLMAEQSANIKKISCPTTKIQNPQRWRAIQPKILGPFDIDADPVMRVLEPVDPERTGPMRVAFSQSGKFCAINRCKDAAFIYRMHPAGSVFPEALQYFTRKQFPKLTREPHGQNDAWNSVTNKPALAAAGHDPSR